MFEAWKQACFGYQAAEIALLRRAGASAEQLKEAERRQMIEKWADATQPYLRFLFEDNS